MSRKWRRPPTFRAAFSHPVVYWCARSSSASKWYPVESFNKTFPPHLADKIEHVGPFGTKREQVEKLEELNASIAKKSG